MLESGAALVSQPTFSRLVNEVDWHAIEAMATALADLYIRGSGRKGARDWVLLDRQGIDDPAHGQQEEVAYHGYYRQHMYHLLLVSDGLTVRSSRRSCARATPMPAASLSSLCGAWWRACGRPGPAFTWRSALIAASPRPGCTPGASGKESTTQSGSGPIHA